MPTLFRAGGEKTDISGLYRKTGRLRARPIEEFVSRSRLGVVLARNLLRLAASLRRRDAAEIREQQVKKMQTEHEINLLIEKEFFGKEILTQEEMRAEAEKTWKEQPDVCYFPGRFFYSASIDSFEQCARLFVNRIDCVWILVEKLSEGYYPRFYQWFDNNSWSLSQMTAREAARAICFAALKEIEDGSNTSDQQLDILHEYYRI